MANSFRKEWSEKLHMPVEFLHEIEAYIQWKLSHLQETTTQFSTVRVNLLGDSQLAWTSVELYIWLYLNKTSLSMVKRIQCMLSFGFPAASLLSKMEWLKSNSSKIHIILNNKYNAYLYIL